MPLALCAGAIFFDVLAVLIVWPELDVFAGGYLALVTLLAFQQALFVKRLSPSPEVRRIFYSQHLDKTWDYTVPALGFAELLVFYDYGHLHLLPELRLVPVQAAGLILLALTIVWLFHVDAYLQKHFAPDKLLTGGPYRINRHPRYLGLIATRLSGPLILASPFAWAIFAVWLYLVHRRVRLEEAYLRRTLGSAYDQYAARTPGLY